MTEEERAARWAEIRARKASEGWVVKKLDSKDPHWSPENPGSFLRGDWCWSLESAKEQEESQQALEVKNKIRIATPASATF